jgi:ABC-type bacteriocin/lantibiotic exporter with double-glycine peptidase domain
MIHNFFIKLLSFSLIAVFLSGCPFEDKEENSNSTTTSIPNYPARSVINTVALPQATQLWCWAASEQMALSAYGVFVSQHDIVTATYGYPADYPGTILQIRQGLSWFGGITSFENGVLALNQIKSSIVLNNPVIIFYNGSFIGHFVVIYGYDNDKIYIHDPYYGHFIVPYSNTFSYTGGGGQLIWAASITMYKMRSNG